MDPAMSALDLTIRRHPTESRITPPTSPTDLVQFTSTQLPLPIYIKTETSSPITYHTYTPEINVDHIETSRSPASSDNGWRRHSPDTTSAFLSYNQKPPTPTTTRPFKAYTSNKSIINYGPHILYQTPEWYEYRKKMLEQMKNSNDGCLNTKMRRDCRNFKASDFKGMNMDNDKDAAYWERRRKNNEAAKKSRDARRQKEDEIAIRAGYLEREYLRLQYENRRLQERLAQYESNNLMYASRVM